MVKRTQVKLFSSWTNQVVDWDNKVEMRSMESDMNAFLEDIDPSQLRTIYVALNDSQRMGLIAYETYMEDES